MANEKRLIDANALKDTFGNYGLGLDVRRRIDLQPTVDAVEVVHGRWVLLAEFFDGSICTECSVCGEEYTYKKGRLELIGVEYAKYNYCPNCGAKMDGDGDGDG